MKATTIVFLEAKEQLGQEKSQIKKLTPGGEVVIKLEPDNFRPTHRPARCQLEKILNN